MDVCESRTLANLGGVDRRAGDQTLDLRETLVALEHLSGSARYSSGWVDTGAVADAIGVSVGEAAARLRVGKRRGLCAIRQSLAYGTRWKPRRPGRAADSQLSLQSLLPDRLPGFTEELGRHIEGSA